MAAEFRWRSRNFLCLWTANFLYFGSFYLLLPTLPPQAALLGATTAQVGLVMGFFTLASVAVRPRCGLLAGRYGRRPVMLVGVGAFGAVYFLYLLVDSVAALYAVRALHGLGHAAFLAAAAAYIADLAPAARRGEVLGYYSLSNILAMAIFPAAGVAWIRHGGGFAGLVLGGAGAALAAWLCVWALRECSGLAPGPAAPLRQLVRRRAVWVPSLALWGGALC